MDISCSKKTLLATRLQRNRTAASSTVATESPTANSDETVIFVRRGNQKKISFSELEI